MLPLGQKTKQIHISQLYIHGAKRQLLDTLLKPDLFQPRPKLSNICVQTNEGIPEHTSLTICLRLSCLFFCFSKSLGYQEGILLSKQSPPVGHQFMFMFLQQCICEAVQSCIFEVLPKLGILIIMVLPSGQYVTQFKMLQSSCIKSTGHCKATLPRED